MQYRTILSITESLLSHGIQYHSYWGFMDIELFSLSIDGRLETEQKPRDFTFFFFHLDGVRDETDWVFRGALRPVTESRVDGPGQSGVVLGVQCIFQNYLQVFPTKNKILFKQQEKCVKWSDTAARWLILCSHQIFILCLFICIYLYISISHVHVYLCVYTHAHTHAHMSWRYWRWACVCTKVSGPAHQHFNRGGQPAGEAFIRLFCVLYFVGILDFALTNSCCLCDLSDRNQRLSTSTLCALKDHIILNVK